MDKDKFWQIIDESREKAGQDNELFLKLLEEQLCRLDTQGLCKFQGYLQAYMDAAYLPGLWDAAIAMNDLYCSSDLFMDFQEWLIAQGRKVYMDALACPDSLVDMEPFDKQNHVYFYLLAENVFKQRTGKELPLEIMLEDAELEMLLQEIKYDPKIHLIQTRHEVMDQLPRLIEKYCKAKNYLDLWPEWNLDDIRFLKGPQWEPSPALRGREENRTRRILKEAGRYAADSVRLIEQLLPDNKGVKSAIQMAARLLRSSVKVIKKEIKNLDDSQTAKDIQAGEDQETQADDSGEELEETQTTEPDMGM